MANLFKKILSYTCFLYTLLSFVLNLIVWFTNGMSSIMLGFSGNMIVLLFCFITSLACIYKARKKKASTNTSLKFYYCVGIVYSFSSICVNVIQYIIKKDNFWNGYTLIILLLFSVVCSFLVFKIKIKNYLISAIFNFFVLGVFYYIIFVIKAGYTKENSLLISLGIYFATYALISIAYYLIIRKKYKKQNSEKSYKSMFS